MYLEDPLYVSVRREKPRSKEVSTFSVPLRTFHINDTIIARWTSLWRIHVSDEGYFPKITCTVRKF